MARLNVRRCLEADLSLEPGAAVVGAYHHDGFIERFEVLAGEVGFQMDGRRRRCAMQRRGAKYHRP